MAILFGTSDGVWTLTDGQLQRLGLAGKKVCHVATRDDAVLATVPYDGLYAVSASGDRLVWQGDARACAIAPDGTYYVGSEPAMIFRSHDTGATWQRSDAIDALPTRSDWYFPPPPHQPHVRSIDFIPGKPDSVLVGIEVGGVLLSPDGGEHWQELNDGLYVDVHTVRPDPSQGGHLMAVTGRGFYASDDDGHAWEKRMEGLDSRYTVGLHVNPRRAGELLVTAGEGPPGVNGYLYHSRDAGRHWQVVRNETLPDAYSRTPVVLFTDDAAWVATQTGQIFRAEQVEGEWSMVCELPATIYAATAGGSPSSVDSGFRR
jgi:photosystem II stability/assembly factor-like uncharacterized protein